MKNVMTRSYLNNNPVITYTERRIIIADDEHSSDV
jgi:hypothetical protein